MHLRMLKETAQAPSSLSPGLRARSWSAPDSMQTLYKRVCEYMELDDRVEVLNNRFQVLPRTPLPPLQPLTPEASAQVVLLPVVRASQRVLGKMTYCK